MDTLNDFSHFKEDDLDYEFSYESSVAQISQIDSQIQSGFACAYCQNFEPNSIVKCFDCEKWFCNNKYDRKESDIFLHLFKSKHRKVCRFQDKDPHGMPIYCQNCQQADIYQLIVVPTQNNLILCIVCQRKSAIGPGKWEPFVQEKRLSLHIFPLSSNKIPEGVKIPNAGQINYIEKQWNKGYIIPIENLGEAPPPVQKKELPVIEHTFKSAQDYINTFLPIIEVAQEDDRRVREGWHQNNVHVNWERGNEGELLAYLNVSNDNYFNGQLIPGDTLQIGNETWKASGTIKYVRDSEVCLIILDTKDHPRIKKVKVQYVFSDVNFKRMTKGLKQIADKKSISQDLLNLILNPTELNNLTMNYSLVSKDQISAILKNSDIPKLNLYQQEAINRSLSDTPLFLIQGPPGTGKTMTLTALLYVIVQLLRSGKSVGKQILVCAPSNTAVDHLAEGLVKNKVGVCRIYSKAREKVEMLSEDLETAALHKKVLKYRGNNYARLHELLKIQEKEVQMRSRDKDDLDLFLDQAERDIIEEVEIVCCTCAIAASKRLINKKFEYVIIDEAAQALEIETLLPLLRGARKAILAGDHMQLGPIVTSKRAKDAKFDRSLFERIAESIKPYRLLVQHRMHNEIAAFPSKQFYNGDLRTYAYIDRPVYKNFPWPDDTKPRFFYNVVGKEETPSTGTSIMNRAEADAVRRIVERFIKSGVKKENIGIITPYNGQKGLIQEMQSEGGFPTDIEVCSVDGYQGREKDFLVISCVRSNEELGIGFLMDQKRLNVALTRPKYGLVLVGNAEVLTQNRTWRNLIEGYLKENLIREGSTRALIPSKINIHKYVDLDEGSGAKVNE